MSSAAPVHLALLITNHYADGAVDTRVTTTVPAPPDGDLNDEEWLDAHIWPHTGTGRSEDAIYEVRVTNTTDPDTIPRDHTWELGG